MRTKRVALASAAIIAASDLVVDRSLATLSEALPTETPTSTRTPPALLARPAGEEQLAAGVVGDDAFDLGEQDRHGRLVAAGAVVVSSAPACSRTTSLSGSQTAAGRTTTRATEATLSARPARSPASRLHTP